MKDWLIVSRDPTVSVWQKTWSARTSSCNSIPLHVTLPH